MQLLQLQIIGSDSEWFKELDSDAQSRSISRLLDTYMLL